LLAAVAPSDALRWRAALVSRCGSCCAALRTDLGLAISLWAFVWESDLAIMVGVSFSVNENICQSVMGRATLCRVQHIMLHRIEGSYLKVTIASRSAQYCCLEQTVDKS
jgi:hypothetical protein